MRVSALRVFLGVAVAAGISAAPAAAQDYRFSVINGTNVPIEYFYYSSCSANDWLSDRLGSNEVYPPRLQQSVRHV